MSRWSWPTEMQFPLVLPALRRLERGLQTLSRPLLLHVTLRTRSSALPGARAGGLAWRLPKDEAAGTREPKPQAARVHSGGLRNSATSPCDAGEPTACLGGSGGCACRTGDRSRASPCPWERGSIRIFLRPRSPLPSPQCRDPRELSGSRWVQFPLGAGFRCRYAEAFGLDPKSVRQYAAPNAAY